MGVLRRAFLLSIALLSQGCGLAPPGPGDLDGVSEAGRDLVERYAALFSDLECGDFQSGIEIAVLAGDLQAAEAIAGLKQRHPCVLLSPGVTDADWLRLVALGRLGEPAFPPPDFYPALCPAGAPPRPAPAVIEAFVSGTLEAARKAAPQAGPCRDALRQAAQSGELIDLYRLSYFDDPGPLVTGFARAGAVCAAGHRACAHAVGAAALDASIAAGEGAYEGVRLTIQHADLIAQGGERVGHNLEQARRFQSAVGRAYGHPPPQNAPRAQSYEVFDWLDSEAVRRGDAPAPVVNAARACAGLSNRISLMMEPAGLTDPAIRACWTALGVLAPHGVFDTRTRLLLALHQAAADGAINTPADMAPLVDGVDRDVFSDVMFRFDFEAFSRDAFNCPRPAPAFKPLWESLPHGPDSAVCARLEASGVDPDDPAGQAALFDWTGCDVEALLDAPWHAARVLLIQTRAGQPRAFECVYAVEQAAEARRARGLAAAPALIAGVRLGHLPEDALALAEDDLLIEFAEAAAQDDYGHLPGWTAATGD